MLHDLFPIIIMALVIKAIFSDNKKDSPSRDQSTGKSSGPMPQKVGELSLEAILRKVADGSLIKDLEEGKSSQWESQGGKNQGGKNQVERENLEIGMPDEREAFAKWEYASDKNEDLHDNFAVAIPDNSLSLEYEDKMKIVPPTGKKSRLDEKKGLFSSLFKNGIGRNELIRGIIINEILNRPQYPK